MKLQILRTFLERLSFFFWIVFTILSISLAGIGIEGILCAGFMLLVSSTQPIHFSLPMVGWGGLGIFLSIAWRQVGIDYLHYLAYDSVDWFGGDENDGSRVLQDLIREVETSEGYARNDARRKAKAWLIDHVSSLDEEDILLAKTHFGYMLPAAWGD